MLPASFVPSRWRHGLQWAATLAAALAAAQVCVALRTPIPWMLGPLLVTMTATLAGLPTRGSVLMRNAGQWVIGAALGLYFTPQVSHLVLSLWWAVLLSALWALVLGGVFGLWLERQVPGLEAQSPRALRATAWFASAIGGASEMASLAERHGGRSDLVAAAHSLRIVMVVVMVPFAMQWFQAHWGLEVDPSLRPGARVLNPEGLAWLGAATLGGALLMLGLRRTNPWFMGPLLASMLLACLEGPTSPLPVLASNLAQCAIGVGLGVRFQRSFLHTAPRWMLAVAWGTAGMLLLSAGFGMALAWLTQLHPAALVLGTSPGGITEMAITAKVLQLGVPVVVAFQVSRLVTVLMLVGPLFHWAARNKPV
jgi:membrane AbrB-like protein